MFERAIANSSKIEISEDDESYEDDETVSSSDDDCEGRPMSVQAMRREAAQHMRPGTAGQSVKPGSPKARHTVI